MLSGEQVGGPQGPGWLDEQTKPTVYEALSKVMADVQAVGKGDRNREQGYDFRGIDAVVNAVGPKLREHGVLVVPELLESTWRDVRTSRDKPARECTVKVRYRFYGPAGDFVEAVTPGESMDFGDKGAAKAMSVAFRIALLQALCIPTHEPDPDASSYERDYERQQWDEAQPADVPTPEQASRFEQLRKFIELAGEADEIAGIGKDVHTSKAEGRITAYHYERLARAASARLAALNAPEATS